MTFQNNSDCGCDPSAALEIPEFLEAPIYSIQSGRHAGEWILRLPASTFNPAQFWIATLIDSFLTAFPWAHIRAFELVLNDSTLLNWNQDDADSDFDAWLSQQDASMSEHYGFTAEVNLDLAWLSPEEETGCTRIPGAAQLFVQRDAGKIVFTVYPNFFTNTFDIHQYVGAVVADSTRIPFEWAARRNRACLRHSLQAWEAAVDGEISGFWSEKIAPIERYGFPEDAQPKY